MKIMTRTLATGRDAVDARTKMVMAAVAVATLVIGAAQYLRTQSIEASKPFLEKKLAWCQEAVETTSYIANAEPTLRATKEMRFWQMYWGVMGLVENREVTRAMVQFGDRLNGLPLDPQGPPTCRTLKDCSLALAHACRDEMANDWSSIWRRW